MREDKLYEAITLIDDDLIDETADYIPKRKRVIHWKRWTALAACLVLAVGVGGTLLGRFGGFGGNSSTGAGGSGSDDGSTFLSYAGPVFPLTTIENAERPDGGAGHHPGFPALGRRSGSPMRKWPLNSPT